MWMRSAEERVGTGAANARRTAFLSVLALAWIAADARGAEEWVVDSGEVEVRCALTVGGSFNATTGALTGALRWDPGAGSRAASGSLRVPLASLDTGIELRNAHLRDTYLETGRGEGFEEAVLAAVELDDVRTTEGANDTRFTGVLRLHGVERPVAGMARIRRSGDRLRVEARFALSLEAFAIPPPRYLGVGVRDEVRVSVVLEASAAP